VRPQARRAIVPAACGQRGLVKGIDLGAASGGERIMPARPRLAALMQPELRLVPAIADDLHATGELRRHLVKKAGAQGRKRGIVEGPGLRVVGNGYARMIDHSRSSINAPSLTRRAASRATRPATVT